MPCVVQVEADAVGVGTFKIVHKGEWQGRQVAVLCLKVCNLCVLYL